MINFFRRLFSLRSAVMLPLIFAVGDANAYITAKITFSPVPEVVGVPLSPWAMGLLGCLLALLAWRVLRQRIPGNGWPLGVLVAAGLLAFGSSKPWLPQASAAADATTFNLVFPSPTISPALELWRNISVVNATGQTIRIDEAEAATVGWYYLSTSAQTPRCQQGLILSPDAVCYVRPVLTP